MRSISTIVCVLVILIAFSLVVPDRMEAQPVHLAIVTVDISGARSNYTGGSYNASDTIAIGYGTNLTVFDLSKANGNYYFEEMYTYDVGFQIDYVAVSDNINGYAFIAVAGNDRPFTNTSHGYVRLYAEYATYENPPEPLLFEMELNHSVYANSSRPIDISRDGDYVAFGTGIVNHSSHPERHTGMVYLVRNPRRYTPSPTYYTYDYQDWIQSVRFAGDNQTLIVGTYWNYSFAKFNLSNLPIFTPDWKAGDISDPYYAVSPSFNAERIATGHGRLHNIRFYRGDANRRWYSEQDGVHRRVVLDDDHEYIVASQYPHYANDVYAFHYFNTTDYLGSKPPIWTYYPGGTATHPATVDSSVSNSTRFIIGGTGPRVYRWGNGTDPISSSTPRFTFVSNGSVNDVAMTYDGEYSVAVDGSGYLYIFQKDEALPIETWRT